LDDSGEPSEESHPPSRYRSSARFLGFDGKCSDKRRRDVVLYH
jgi:hypothetical protein